MSLPDADAQVRTDGTTDYVFVLNFSPAPARVEYGGEAIDLGPYANVVIERPQI